MKTHTTETTPATHTPGPWLVTGIEGSDCVMIGGDDGSDVVCDLRTDRPRDEKWANAALIAAAPDLLLALRMAAVLLWKNHKVLRGPNPQDIDEAFEAMRAAISKAEGRA